MLEYRGYDSAGVALIDAKAPHKIEIRKEAGKLASLIHNLDTSPISGFVGIGHTRWATHGKPTQKNAHPHPDIESQLCVVHNGIVENHLEIREDLTRKGIQFSSETDSEVISQLIGYQLRQGMDIKEAFFQTLKQLKGSFAVVMVSQKSPGSIYAARKGSPLIAGVKDQELFLASDPYPVLRHTQEILYLDENDVVIFENKTLSLFTLEGKPKTIQTTHVESNYEKVSHIGFESYTQKEIHEQPDILDRILKLRLHSKQSDNAWNLFFEELKADANYFKSVDRIYITACGTAFHAGYIGKYYFEEFLDLPVEVILSSEFRYSKPKLNQKNLVIAVSQSGETADTLASIIEAKKHGSKVLSLVNVLNSSIDRESDFSVYTHAGPEIGVASTKAFTSQVLTLLLLAIHIANLRQEFNRQNAPALYEDLWKLPDQVRKILKLEESISTCALKYHLANSALYLGRHLNYPIALEGALKNKEISYMHAEGYAAGEMKHGPIALIDKTLPVICIATESTTYDKMLSNIKETEAREGIIITLATEGDTSVAAISREVIYIPKTSQELYPILNVIALQLLAYYFAHHKGNEIDQPRNLAKSVTVE